ncbi:Lrp/AsnC family transcriptional regulator [Frateuria aurantia]
MPTLNTFDKQILRLLQRDGGLSQSQIGEQVNLSTAAVNRRIKSMQAEGIIDGQVAVLDPRRLGYPLTLIVEVRVESERIDLLEEMQRNFLACPQVQQCYYVTGECDFVLIFLVRDMEHYVALSQQLFHANPNIRGFRTMVAMSRLKTGMTVPVDD